MTAEQETPPLPDSNAKPYTNVVVESTPEDELPEYGSVTVTLSGTNSRHVLCITPADALKLYHALGNHLAATDALEATK